MYRLGRRTQRRESMLLFGSLPPPSAAGNDPKVIGPRPGYSGQKTIADAADGLQKDRLGGIVFNVTAQADHEVVDGTRVGVLAHSPYLLQQLLAGDDASLVEHQIAEQIALHQG